MRIFTLAASLLLSWFVIAHANAEEDAPVPLLLKARPDSTANIQYTHLKSKNGSSNEGEIDATLHIERLVEDGFIAQWTTNSVSVGGFIIDNDSPQAATFLIGIPFSFVANKDGTPIRIHNRDALLASLRESEAFSKIDPADAKQTIDFFAGLPEDSLAQIFIKVPTFMAFCQGTSLTVGESFGQQVESPNPMGDGTILSDAVYMLHSVDHKRKEAKIEYSFSFNPESLREITLQAAKKLAPKEEFSAEELSGLAISRRDSANCILDIDTGWVKNMQYSKTIVAGSESQIEKFDISIKWDD